MYTAGQALRSVKPLCPLPHSPVGVATSRAMKGLSRTRAPVIVRVRGAKTHRKQFGKSQSSGWFCDLPAPFPGNFKLSSRRAPARQSRPACPRAKASTNVLPGIMIPAHISTVANAIFSSICRAAKIAWHVIGLSAWHETRCLTLLLRSTPPKPGEGVSEIEIDPGPWRVCRLPPPLQSSTAVNVRATLTRSRRHGLHMPTPTPSILSGCVYCGEPGSHVKAVSQPQPQATGLCIQRHRSVVQLSAVCSDRCDDYCAARC